MHCGYLRRLTLTQRFCGSFPARPRQFFASGVVFLKSLPLVIPTEPSGLERAAFSSRANNQEIPEKEISETPH